MKKVCVLGHFGFGKELLNGQTVKTKMVADSLEAEFTDGVYKIDSCGGVRTLFKAPFQIFSALKNSENVVILPAHNGLRIYAPLLSFGKGFFKKRKIHYAVIGGWLPKFLDEHRSLIRSLKKFDGIYVETNTMKKALEEKGFENVCVVPNCKNLKVLQENELIYPTEKPYKLCTFSRVMKEKGIETAASVIDKINGELGYKAYTLDIYGQVDASQTEWFKSFEESLSDSVRYCGCVSADKSVEVLKSYFALLFPTHFYTEGIPGTVIDAYAAGIPVISAKWESYFDVIDDGVTGIGYEFDNIEQLEELLLDAIADPDRLLNMKKDCIQKANDYIPSNALRVMVEKF